MSYSVVRRHALRGGESLGGWIVQLCGPKDPLYYPINGNDGAVAESNQDVAVHQQSGRPLFKARLRSSEGERTRGRLIFFVYGPVAAEKQTGDQYLTAG